jgi:hypothetical protein
MRVYITRIFRKHYYCYANNNARSQGSSVSIVSDYGLDDRMIGVRSLAEANDFSCSVCVQTGSGAHPAYCKMGTGGPFPGDKARKGRDADHSPPSSAEVVNEYELYILSHQAPPWRVAGVLCFNNDENYCAIMQTAECSTDRKLSERSVHRHVLKKSVSYRHPEV